MVSAWEAYRESKLLRNHPPEALIRGSSNLPYQGFLQRGNGSWKVVWHTNYSVTFLYETEMFPNSPRWGFKYQAWSLYYILNIH